MDESTFLAACRTGSPVDLLDNGTPGTIDADLIRRVCRRHGQLVDPRGIRLHNATVVGALDLSGLDVPFPVRFENCRFDSALVLDGASLHGLAVTNCAEVPGLLANGLRVRRDLDLSGSHIVASLRTSASTSRGAAVWLCGAEIGGLLLGVGTVIDGSGDRAVQADRMRVGGSVRLIRGFTAHGEVRLLGVQVDGSIDLTGAHLTQRTGLALDLADAAIGGSVFLITGVVVRGRIGLNTARISGHLMVRDARLSKPVREPANGGYTRRREAGTALSAPRLHVGGEVSFEGDCVISGGLDMSGGDLGDVFVESSCRLQAPGRTAIDLTHAELRSNLVLDRVTVEGTLRFTGTHVHGNLSLRAATLSDPERISLIAAQGAVIDGDVDLNNLHAAGGRLAFRSATLGSVLEAGGARLDNPSGQTINLHQAVVGGSVCLTDGFTSIGAVVLTRAAIGGRLECRAGVFESPEGHAIQAYSVTVRGGLFLNWARVTPSVAFVDSVTTVLADDPTNWPDRFAISGLTYERFAEPSEGHALLAWDWRLRCAWLRRQSVFDAGPYEQVSRVFRQHGYATEAEEILINQRTEARRAGSGRRPGAMDPGDGLVRRARRMVQAIFGWSVGYGYRPGRVLWMLAALLLAVLLSVTVPAGRDVLRATDPSGDVYTPTGLLVSTVAGTAAGHPGTHDGFAEPATTAPHADACGDGQVRCFEPIFFAIDTVVPLVSLGQRDTWYPDTDAPGGEGMDVWLELSTLAGWLLSSVFVLSFTRLARSAGG